MWVENVKSEIAPLPPWHRQQRKCFHMTFFEPKFPTRKTQRGKIRGNRCSLGGLLAFAWEGGICADTGTKDALGVSYGAALSPLFVYANLYVCLKMQSHWCIDTWTLFFPAGIHFNLAPDSYFVHSPKPQNQDRFTACTIWMSHGGGKTGEQTRLLS